MADNTTFTLFRSVHARPAFSWSPFANKLEARFRFANVAHSVAVGSPLAAPRGKIPFLRVSTSQKDGGPAATTETLSDTTLIINELTERGMLTDLNARLSPRDRALDAGLRALLEEKMYFYQVRERWIENYTTMRDTALCAIPYPVRLIVGLLAHRSIVTGLHFQGTGRFTGEEIKEFKEEGWRAISDLLTTSRARRQAVWNLGADEPFWAFGGEEPTELDATLFGFVVSVLVCEAGPESREVLRSFPVLMDYADRIWTRYFSDYKRWEEPKM